LRLFINSRRKGLTALTPAMACDQTAMGLYHLPCLRYLSLLSHFGEKWV
jgi:hypothetical protein